MFTDPKKSSQGLFAVDWQENFVHWLAWREWQHDTFGKHFFPQVLTVPTPWPPETAMGADAFGDWLKDIRSDVGKESPKTGGGPCLAVPDAVMPWRGWPELVKRRIGKDEIDRRANDGSSFTSRPNYPWRANTRLHVALVT